MTSHVASRHHSAGPTVELQTWIQGIAALKSPVYDNWYDLWILMYWL